MGFGVRAQGLLGEQHVVDDVRDAVRRLVVGRDDTRVEVEEDAAALVLEDRDVAALHRGDLLVVEELARRDVARDDVVREHLHERGLVRGLEQVGEEVGRQRGEGVVGGRKDRAGARL